MKTTWTAGNRHGPRLKGLVNNVINMEDGFHIPLSPLIQLKTASSLHWFLLGIFTQYKLKPFTFLYPKHHMVRFKRQIIVLLWDEVIYQNPPGDSSLIDGFTINIYISKMPMYPLLLSQVKKLTWTSSCLFLQCFDTIIWTAEMIGQKVINMKTH